MSTLQHWEERIKEKRKNTPFRDFLKELASWQTITFYKIDNFISRYSPNNNVVKNIVPTKQFASLRDSLVDYGIEYSGLLFSDIKTLLSIIPLESLKQFDGSINTDYVDIAIAKNAYLSIIVVDSENVAYSSNVKGNCHDIYNSVMVWENSSDISFSRGVINSYKIFYSSFIQGSNNIRFSSNLIGCSECLLCEGLENKHYCINNKQLSKEDYFQKKSEILESKSTYLDNRIQLANVKGKNYGGTKIQGEFNIRCNNLNNAYMNYDVRNGNNVVLVATGDVENVYDFFSGGIGVTKEIYGLMGGGINVEKLFCCVETAVNSQSIYYSYYIESCSFCIGCVGLKNKSYCILNKQYTKEEWYELADKIFASMEADGSLGKFFPGNLNPFYFNDTMAYLLDDSFTKEEVTAEGYLRRDEEIKVDIPLGMEVVSASELGRYQGYDADGRWTINPEVLKIAIKDDKGNIYRIVKMEYDFLVKHELPLPELHWMDRIKLGFKF